MKRGSATVHGSMAIDCLSYNEDDRPSAQELCHRLAALKEAPQYGDSVHKPQKKNRPAEDTTGDRERQIRKLQLWKEVKSTEQICGLQQQLQVSKDQIQEKGWEGEEVRRDGRVRRMRRDGRVRRMRRDGRGKL